MLRLVPLAVVALVGAVLTPAAGAAAGEPTRVLVVGDSVTHGDAGEYTWRYFSWKGLQETGADVDFVGPHRGTFTDADPFGGHYADPDFDTDHAARRGLSMWETLYWNSDTAPSVESLVVAHEPDVVVEALGVNDFQFLDQTAADLTENAKAFVARARAVRPDVDVVLASIPQTWIDEVPAYNAALPGLAASLSTPESRVEVTPVARLTRGVDTYSGAHPTTRGQRKIAAAVSVALADLGLGSAITMPAPAVPGANDPVTAPAEPRRVHARRRNQQVVVTWRRAATAVRYDARCGSRSRTTRHARVVLRAPATRCKVRSVNRAGVSRWVVVRVTA